MNQLNGIRESRSKKALLKKDLEQKLALLVINTEEPCAVTDTSLHIITFNAPFAEQYFSFYGKKIEKGTYILDYAQEERKELLKEIYKKALKGETQESELEVHINNNEIRTLLLRYKPAYNEAYEIIGACISCSDISERKKAQKLLSESERRFRTLVENGSDAIVIMDANGKPKYFSPSVERLIGYTEKEALKLDIAGAVHPEDHEAVAKVLETARANPGKAISGHTGRMLHKDGTWRYYEATITNMLHDPLINGIVSNFRDVTEKTLAEQEKQFDHHNLHALINTTNDLMWSVSRDGKLISSNRAFDEMVKYMSGHDVVKGADAPTKGFPEEQLKKWDQLYTRAFSGETFTIVEYTDFPVEYWSEISFYPFKNEGEVVGIACYARNITERKLFERQLEKNTAEILEFKNELERSEASLREAQEMAALGSWETDFRTFQTRWSDQFYKIINVDKEGLTPSLEIFLSFVHPEDQARVRKTIDQGLESLKEYFFNCRIVTTDGIVKHIQSSCRFIMDESGSPQRIQGIIQDITERKRSEEKLQHSESRLKQAQEVAHLGNWEVNFATNISLWSDESYRIYGLEPTEHGLSYEEWLQFMHPEDLEGFFRLQKKAEESLEGFSYVHRIIRRDGSIRHIASQSRYELDQHGKPIGLYGTALDITDRIKAEEELVGSHRLLQKLTDKVPVVVYQYQIDQNGKMSFPFMSKAINEIFPDVDTEVLKYDISLLFAKVHPEDSAMLLSSIQTSMEQLSEWNLEFRTYNDKKEIVWIRGSSRPETGEHGAIIWHGFLQNITGKKLDEESLKIAKERYDIVARATSDVIWDWDLINNKTKYNQSMYQVFGYKESEVKETTDWWDSKLHPADQERILTVVDNFIKTKDSNLHLEYRFRCADGSYRSVLDRAVAIRDENGKAIRMIGAMQDITERKNTEELVRQSKERYDFVVKATNDAIYDWDLKTGNIVRTGEGLNILFGFNDPAEVSAQGFWRSRVHPDDVNECYRKLNECLNDSQKEVCDMEYRFQKADGTYAHVYDKGYIVRDAEGTATRLIGATRDMTHRKETELLLKELNENLEKRASELSRSNSELEQFAYIASHDLQEPLRMVTSFLTQLENKYKDQLDDKAKKYIYFATDGATRMRRIILDLLEYSRVGRQSSGKEHLDMNVIVSDAVQMNSTVMQEKGAVIFLDNLPSLNGSRSALQQLFHNLVGNALKYQKPGQKPRIEIKAQDKGSHWEFAISDNGIGIEPQYFEKIFIVFQRLHNKDEYSGTGIGLAICKKIVENHGGNIWVKSEYGSGTTFYFTISKNLEQGT